MAAHPPFDPLEPMPTPEQPDERGTVRFTPVKPGPATTRNFLPYTLGALSFMSWAAEHYWLFAPRFLSGFRTYNEQTWLWMNAKLPASYPGTSQHEYGLAFDLAPAVTPGDPLYREQVEVLRWLAQYWGIQWGGARDPAHYSLLTDNQWADFLGINGARMDRHKLVSGEPIPRTLLEHIGGPNAPPAPPTEGVVGPGDGQPVGLPGAPTPEGPTVS